MKLISITFVPTVMVLTLFACKGKDSDSPSRELGPIAKPCFSRGIKEVFVPLNPSQPDSSQISYRYQWIEHGESLPTIVSLPGGPGQDAIRLGNNHDDLSNQYNHILIDPRGVGCNYKEEGTFTEELITTEFHAHDILKVIEAEGLSNYLLHGVSYGTVVGTHLGKLLESSDLPLPKALVMEGVLGKYLNATEQEQRFIDVWNKLKAKIPRMDKFFGPEPYPFNLSAQEWTNFNRIMISLFGSSETNVAIYDALIDHKLYGFPLNESLREILYSDSDSEFPGFKGEEEFYLAIGCREIFEANPSALTMKGSNLELVPLTELLGADIQAIGDAIPSLCLTRDLSRPFESRDLQINKIPLYYLQGESDPNTPLEQAIYHFEGQNSEAKELYIFPDNGHNPFQLLEASCQNKLYDQFLKGKSAKDILGDDGLCSEALALTHSESDAPQRELDQVLKKGQGRHLMLKGFPAKSVPPKGLIESLK